MLQNVSQNTKQMATKYSILISYLIGAPIGLITVVIFYLFPMMLTREGIFTILITEIYEKAIIGLIIAFLVALGVGGKKASENLNDNNTLIIASFKYSLFVNLVIWSTFTIILLISSGESFHVLLFIPPFIAFMISLFLTTVTIGLLICYLIKRKIRSITFNQTYNTSPKESF